MSQMLTHMFVTKTISHDATIRRIVPLLFAWTFLAMTLIGCRSFYDLTTYSKAAAKGAISANDFTVLYGYTDPEAKLPDGQEYMMILTPAKPKHACPDSSDKLHDSRELIATIDGKIGEMVVNPQGTRIESEETMFSYKKESRTSSVAFLNPSLPKEDQYKFAKTGKIKLTKKNC